MFLKPGECRVFFLEGQNREKRSTTGRIIGQVNPIMPEVNNMILIV